MKETYYFNHDYNARNDPKLINLQIKYGMQGIGIYWCLIEMIYEESGYLPLEYERISFVLRIDKNVIQSVVNDFDLFQIINENITSKAVFERIEERANKSAKARESVNKRWDKYERNTNVTKKDTIKEKKRKEKKESSNISFDIFWELYDKKIDAKKCKPKWDNLSLEIQQKIINYIPKYTLTITDKKFKKHPLTFLNSESWENELIGFNEEQINDKFCGIRDGKYYVFNIERSESEYNGWVIGNKAKMSKKS